MRIVTRASSARIALAAVVGVFVSADLAKATQVLMDFGGTTGVDSVNRTWTDIIADANTSQANTLIPLKNAAGGGSTGFNVKVTNSAATVNGSASFTKGFANNRSDAELGNDDFTYDYSDANITAKVRNRGATGDLLSRNYPASAYNSTEFANFTGTYNNISPISAVTLTFSGLSQSDYYRFDFFSGRGAAQERDTQFTITGGALGTGKTVLNVNSANNTNQIVIAGDFRADSSGSIKIDIANGTTNLDQFYYLNTLELNSSATPIGTLAVPEPASLAGVSLVGLAALHRRRRSGR